MDNLFYTSDLHFYDEKIISICNRPFSNVKEMNEVLIENWNKTVKPKSKVFIEGDFAFAKASLIADILKQLNGEKHLILGNHDRCKSPSHFRNLGFKEVYPYPIIIDHQYIILSHEPLFVNKSSPFFNIYGHIHNDDRYKTVAHNSCCVCVERWNYKPVSFLQILKEYRKLGK